MSPTLSRLTEAIHHETASTFLGVMKGPHPVRGLGVVGRVAFFDRDTLEGPAAELLLLAEGENEDAVVAELAERGRSLGPEHLGDSLTELLGRPELTDPLAVDNRQQWEAALARLQGEQHVRASISVWRIPGDVLALAALFQSASSWEQAALAALGIEVSPWIAAVLESDAAADAALRSEVRASPLTPVEFIRLFSSPFGDAFGYWFDSPAQPVGFASFHRGQVGMLPQSPCQFLAEKAKAEATALEGIELLEMLVLEAAAQFFHDAASGTR